MLTWEKIPGSPCFYVLKAGRGLGMRLTIDFITFQYNHKGFLHVISWCLEVPKVKQLQQASVNRNNFECMELFWYNFEPNWLLLQLWNLAGTNQWTTRFVLRSSGRVLFTTYIQFEESRECQNFVVFFRYSRDSDWTGQGLPWIGLPYTKSASSEELQLSQAKTPG